MLADEEGNLLFAGWSKGRNQSYPYYRFSSGSAYKGKSIRAEKVHKRLELYFRGITLSPKDKEAFKKLLIEHVNGLKSQVHQRDTSRELKIQELEKEYNSLMDKIIHYSNPTLIQKIESQLSSLELTIRGLKESNVTASTDKRLEEEVLEATVRLILSPRQAWEQANHLQKKKFIEMWFKEPLKVSPVKNGVLNRPQSALREAFQVFDNRKNSHLEMTDTDLNHF
ncbi:hypothetical protein SAMN05421780_11331 [Flexibacter flexilis DSM 6793]|uniref:Recombinase n=1 Tax=Flexibacter flexilis DSM 6793 TaxID=927664 RepID=A0A1I1N7T3_9BACT|nr:hypothetical protein [Flexibacter flexilis]SFC93679.1 hypothetical protein SAMN05421780_11331 [Flexibacter flexilis DSM 6793]